MLEFAKVYFAKCNLAGYSPKFTPAKVSLYTVLQNCLNVQYVMDVSYFPMFLVIYKYPTRLCIYLTYQCGGKRIS